MAGSSSPSTTTTTKPRRGGGGGGGGLFFGRSSFPAIASKATLLLPLLLIGASLPTPAGGFGPVAPFDAVGRRSGSGGSGAMFVVAGRRWASAARSSAAFAASSSGRRGASAAGTTKSPLESSSGRRRSLVPPATNRRPRPSLGSSALRSAAADDARASSSSSANRDLVAERLAAAAARKAARRAHLDDDRQRNLRLKRLLSTDGSGAAAAAGGDANSTSSSGPGELDALYQIRVSVCPVLRSELRMNGREKRGRVFLERESEGTTSIVGLRKELHEFFRALKKGHYVLQGGLPEVDEEGRIAAPTIRDEEGGGGTSVSTADFWPIETDNDVLRTFSLADSHFSDLSSSSEDELDSSADIQKKKVLKRPSILLHVRKDPKAPPPPPTPSYLVNLPDHQTSPTLTMLSFYSFPPGGILDPEETARRLRGTWSKLGALGRVYVANEGINAQMAVPTNVLDRFDACCREGFPDVLGNYTENGLNIDPVPLTREEFSTAGDMNGKPAPPFKNLHVRVRNQIVADGLLDRTGGAPELNWEEAGYDMPPEEWHEKLREAREKRESVKDGEGEEDNTAADPLPVILDCRNDYETEVGKFVGAEPLGTENFRDSWEVLEERLRDTPKDAPIMTYCTGGIRCVKVGAYLTQEMGFKNVSRLAGGIIAYDRTLNERNKKEGEVGRDDDNERLAPDGNDGEGEESLFRGTNFVFDGRVGRKITDDATGECITCGAPSSLVGNCANDNCHKRMVQCEKCRGTFLGTCSEACKNRVVFMRERGSGMTTGLAAAAEGESSETTGGGVPSSSSSSSSSSPRYSNVQEYSAMHTTTSPPLYDEIERNTARFLPTGAHMTSGSTQGRLLAQIASSAREGRILELGTFTGYATCCLLEGSARAAEEVASAGRQNGSGASSSSAENDGPRGREGGPFVLTLERDADAIDLAASHLRIMAEYGAGEEAAVEASKLRGKEGGPVDRVAEEDSFSVTYGGSSCEILRTTDALAVVEEMARGNGGNGEGAPAPFDVVFVDADKTRLLDYVEACTSTDRLLKRGGLILVDNVLWKGLAVDAGNGWSRTNIEEEEEDGMTDRELKKNRRARKLAGIMHAFNDAVVNDERLEVVMLPLRDGLSIIRKR